MRKLMAICLSVLMVLSMCSFSVMAEGAVDFSVIANGQPANFVTGNLDLLGYTITSSNEDVIALDGTVTRPLMEDETVTLTINGGEAVEVTVKAKNVEVLAAEDFTVAAEAAAKTGGGWTFGDYRWSISSANYGGSEIKDGKFYLNHTDEYPTDDTPDSIGRVWLYRSIETPVTDEAVTIQFDVADIENVATGIDIRLSGYKYDAEGNIIGSIPSGTSVARLSASGFGTYAMGSYKKEGVSIKYNPVTGEFWGNGTLKEEKNLITEGGVNDGYTTDDVAKVVVTSICFVDAADSATGNYSIDNFVVYQDVSAEDVLANATADEKALYYASCLDEEYVANGGSFAALTTNLNFAADEELPEGVSITWESSDEAVIATDGTVTRPFFEAKDVTIEGALVIDGEEVKTVTYDVTVLPLSISSTTEVVDAENLALGSFVGADGWTDSIKDWEAMEVKEDADGNKYFSICASAYQPSGTSPKYTFASNPVIGEGETLVFEAKVRIPVKAGLANWGLLLNGSEIAEFIYHNGYLYDNDYDLGTDAYYGAGDARTDKLVTAGQWYDIRFEITEDAAAAKGWTVNCFIDGNNVGTHSTKTAVPAEITSTAFLFTGRSNMDSTTEPTTPVNYFDTDDICVYTSRAIDSVLADLDDAEKATFFAELAGTLEIADVTAGQDLGLADAYASYDLDALGVSIVWESEDESYISDNGIVKKLAPIGEKVTVTLTATAVAGTETATATVDVEIGDGIVAVKSYDFNSDEVGTTMGSAAVVADGLNGNAVYMKNEAASHKSSGTIANVTDGGRGDRVVIEADVKYIHGASEAAYGAFRILTYAGKAGIQVGINYNTNKIGLLTTKKIVDGAATALSVSTGTTVYYDMPASVSEKGEGEWIHITVDHNVLSQTYQVYVDGNLINEVPVLQANMDLGGNGGSAIRGYSLELSLEGEMWVDNVELSKYENTDAVEVNAALNAALVQYASEEYRSVLTPGALPAMTIGKSWINGTAYDRDVIETVTDNDDGTTKTTYSIKTENASTYKYVTDGPAITWTVNGEAVTAITADKPAIVDLTVTASANGITESFTTKRRIAPVVIRDLAQGTASCLNGLWLEGATGTEKVVVVQCGANGKPLYSYTPATDEEEEYEWYGTKVYDLTEISNAEGNVSYNPETGLLKGTGVTHPSESDASEEVRIMVFRNGIAPIAFAEAIYEW